MDDGDYWPPRAAAWKPEDRIYPRYAPEYKKRVILQKVDDEISPECKKRIILQKVDDEIRDYRYSVPAETRYATRQPVLEDDPYRPFGYASYYKPVATPIPVLAPFAVAVPDPVPVPVPVPVIDKYVPLATTKTTAATTGTTVETCKIITYIDNKNVILKTSMIVMQKNL